MELTAYRFLSRLAALPWVEALYLYGSRARGDHRPRSDIDLAVECPTATPAQWQAIMDIIDDADTLLPIDCVRLDTLPPASALRASILRERRLLAHHSEVAYVG